MSNNIKIKNKKEKIIYTGRSKKLDIQQKYFAKERLDSSTTNMENRL